MGWVVCQNLNDSINIPQGCKKSEYILYQGHHCSSNETQLARILAVKGASQPKFLRTPIKCQPYLWNLNNFEEGNPL